jgi:hypothetical protein
MPPVTTTIRFVILSIRDRNFCEDHEYFNGRLAQPAIAFPQRVAASSVRGGTASALIELRGFLEACGIARMKLGAPAGDNTPRRRTAQNSRYREWSGALARL